MGFSIGYIVQVAIISSVSKIVGCFEKFAGKARSLPHLGCGSLTNKSGLGWKGMLGTNALGYLATLSVTEKKLLWH
jgi:hypothetical protein